MVQHNYNFRPVQHITSDLNLTPGNDLSTRSIDFFQKLYIGPMPNTMVSAIALPVLSYRQANCPLNAHLRSGIYASKQQCQTADACLSFKLSCEPLAQVR